MLSIFKYTAKYLSRERSLLLWALLFPILLATLFSAMFSNLSKDYAFEPFKLGVVRDANYASAPEFDAVLSSVSAGGSDTQYLSLSDCSSTTDGDAQTNAGTIDGYVTVDDSGTPELHLSHADYDSKTASTSATVIQSILDAYVHTVYEYKEVYERNPALLADSSTMQAFQTDAVSTARLAVTRTSPDPSVRYYYALLGMAAGLAAMLALRAVQRTQGNVSALGARRVLGGIPRWKVLVATICASWACSFVCLLLAFAYMRFAIGVDFGGREGWCLVALAVTSIMASAAGAFAGTFPNLQPGIISAITCLLSLFTGLYGSSAQELADTVSASVPWLSAANPMWEIAHSFYSLLYYDSLWPFATSCFVLSAMAAAFLVVAALRMRRQRYEHL